MAGRKPLVEAEEIVEAAANAIADAGYTFDGLVVIAKKWINKGQSQSETMKKIDDQLNIAITANSLFQNSLVGKEISKLLASTIFMQVTTLTPQQRERLAESIDLSI